MSIKILSQLLSLISLKPWVVNFDVLYLLPPFSQVGHLLSDGHH